MEKRRLNEIEPGEAPAPAVSVEAGVKAPAIPRLQLLLAGVGILLTMLPVTMIVPVLKELVSERFQIAPFWAHAFMSTSLAGSILLAPFAGILIDRSRSRRPIIFFALVGEALCFAAMALAPSFLILMLARFIEGGMHIAALSAWLAAGADLSAGPQTAGPGRARAGRVMGALGGVLMLGISIGVPLGGVIAKTDSLRVLWAAALVAGITALLALALAPGRKQPNPSFGLRQFAAVLKQNHWLALPYTYAFIDRLCIGVVVSTLTLYMTDILRFDPAQRGMELAFFLLPFAGLSYFVGRLSDRIGRVWLMASGSLLFGFVFMSYGYLSGSGMTVAMIASGVLSAVMFAPNLAMCKDLSTAENHGTAFAGYNVAGSLGFMAGPLLGGGLFAGFNSLFESPEAYRYTFLVAGSFEVLCALVSLPFLARLRRSKRVF